MASKGTIQHLITSHPAIAILTPADPAFEATSACFVHRPHPNSLAIARPKTADEVCTLVEYCIASNLPFVVRAGGHDTLGRSQVADALTIDLRDIAYVHVDHDKSTARVGGGVLLTTVTEELGKHGLVTPVGTMGFVGYVGWAVMGGFGPLSGVYGLGVDQIVGAKIVTAAAGEAVDADEELLKGIRGAGTALGVIVELTVKTYPLRKILSGSIVQPTGPDHGRFVGDYLAAFRGLRGAGMPEAFSPFLSIWNIPDVGPSIVTMAVWASPDHDEGWRWVRRLEALAPSPVLNTVAAGTLARCIADNQALASFPVHGRNVTLSVRGYTDKVVDIIARHTAELPARGAGFCVHHVDGRAVRPSEDSVWGPRGVEHLVLEFISATVDEASVDRCAAWASAFRGDFVENAPEDVLEGGWAAMVPDDETDVTKMFAGNSQFVLDLKRKHDPHNVFNNTVPKLLV